MNLEQVEILISQSRYALAYEKLQDILTSDPMDYEALTYMAVSCINLDKFEEAEAALQTMGQIYPENAYGLYLFANLEVKRNNHQKALDILDQGINVAPQTGVFYDLKSRIYNGRKDYAAAAFSAEKALEIEPNNVDFMNSLAIAWNGQGKTAQANELIEKALQEDPTNYETHANYGYRSLEKGDVKKATEHFQQSLLVNPTFAYAQAGMKEAMKAQFILYRWLLRFQLYMAKQKSGSQLFVFIGIYGLSRLLGVLAENGNGSLQVLVYILLGILVLFVFSTWVLDPIMNFILYTNERGRLALDNSETQVAKGAGVSLLMITVGTILGLTMGASIFYYLAMLGFLGLFYYPSIFSVEVNQTHRRVSIGFFGFTVIMGFLGLSLLAIGNPYGESLLFTALLSTILYTWVGNSVFWQRFRL